MGKRWRYGLASVTDSPTTPTRLRQHNRIKFATLFTEELRHREPRRGSRWHLDEVCTSVDGVRHWLWRAVDEHGFVLDILLSEAPGYRRRKDLPNPTPE